MILQENVVSCNSRPKRLCDIRSNHEPNHKDATLAQLVSVPAGSDAEDAGHNVRRDGHKLSHFWCACGAQVVDDGRQEERVRVQAGVDADGDEHVDPDLPVLERIPEVLQVKLVGERRPVALQPGLDLEALLLG
jgi:hypothetical protein